MRLSLFWAVLVAACASWLALANRAPVWFSFDPVAASGSGFGLHAPLFGLMLAAFGLGALAGGLAVFLSTLKVRARARDERKEAEGFVRAVSTTTGQTS